MWKMMFLLAKKLRKGFSAFGGDMRINSHGAIFASQKWGCKNFNFCGVIGIADGDLFCLMG